MTIATGATAVTTAGEFTAFRAAHPGIEAVQLYITDPSGVPRGKLAALHELERLYTAGRPVAGSILGLDVTGRDVEATGLVWETGDADLLCRPVPGTLRPAPWLARPTAQVMMSMYALTGEPAPADPRPALARAAARLAARGHRAVLAVELEVYLLAPRGEAVAAAVPPGSAHIDAYSLARRERTAPLFDEVYAAAHAQGLPVETLMSEYAPGQFELTLAHRDDALRAVDEAVMLKRLLRGVAAKHGLAVTFMAKPYAHLAGSGMHLHVSLADAAGRNLFAAEEPAGTPLLRQALGGLKATMAESLLAFAPNGNSYRRFQSESYAPTAVSWGVNNRSVSLRVPAGPASSRHIEHRIAGADANPYVAAAVVLAGVEHGIAMGLDPGPPVIGNGYAAAAAASGTPIDPQLALPRTWQEAIDRAAGSAFLAEALGPEFLKVFLAIKRQECARFSAEVTELDRSWYLHTA
ncbi:MAG: glutamine synthetase family protein [Gammaproteobacteria bacterium]